MKRKYTIPQMETLTFDEENIITTSVEDDLPIVPLNIDDVETIE